jgi:alanyl-tRNA synthetase
VDIHADVPVRDQDGLRRAGDHLRAQKGSGILVLGSVTGGQPRIVVMVTKDLQGTAVHAGKIAAELSSMMDGRGGGTAEVGQGGGRDPSRLSSVLNEEAVRKAIEKSAGQPDRK